MKLPGRQDLDMLRDGARAIAERNGHQVDALELRCTFDEERGMASFVVTWSSSSVAWGTAHVGISERAIAGRYAREEFDAAIARIFPPPPPLPPVFLDAGAGI